MMQITVNGKPHQSPDRQTVRELIIHLGMDKTAVAVEINEQLVRRADHESTQLKPGDQVELVKLVGGG